MKKQAVKKMDSKVLMVMVAVLLFGVDISLGVNPEPVYCPTTNHYYAIVDGTGGGFTWSEAKVEAENMSYLGVQGHLVTITSQAEQEFVVTAFGGWKKVMRHWMGGFQTPGSIEPDGGWYWITGEVWDYSHWFYGEPNDSVNESALIFWDEGGWNDLAEWKSASIYYPTQEYIEHGFIVEFPVCQVAIDIKPGSDPNSVNPKSKGVLPVAILGAEDFDVYDVDLLSLELAGAAPRTKGKSGKIGSFEDVNGDGLTDLMLHFDMNDLNIAQDTSELVLEGWLNDGTTLIGSDSIRIVPAR